MKTIAQVVRENPEYKNLINAVVSRIGKDSIEDVVNHGIDGGFNGFIYYSDTVKFFKTYKADIMRLASRMADDLGEDLLSMIQGFRCIGKDFSQSEIAESLYSSATTDASTTVRNGMAWFAAEEVCRMFEN